MQTPPETDSDLAPVTLVLGGARSGKSAFAERLAERRPQPVYLATGQALDVEMAARIARHRERRGERWTTLEEPLELAAAIADVAGPERAVLVDCLTLWLNNLLAAGRDVDAAAAALAGALSAAPGPVILVSSEVGLGIVPDNALARAFRDHAGALHQRMAAIAQRVYFVTAGLPLAVKDTWNRQLRNDG